MLEVQRPLHGWPEVAHQIGVAGPAPVLVELVHIAGLPGLAPRVAQRHVGAGKSTVRLLARSVEAEGLLDSLVIADHRVGVPLPVAEDVGPDVPVGVGVVEVGRRLGAVVADAGREGGDRVKGGVGRLHTQLAGARLPVGARRREGELGLRLVSPHPGLGIKRQTDVGLEPGVAQPLAPAVLRAGTVVDLALRLRHGLPAVVTQPPAGQQDSAILAGQQRALDDGRLLLAQSPHPDAVGVCRMRRRHHDRRFTLEGGVLQDGARAGHPGELGAELLGYPVELVQFLLAQRHCPEEPHGSCRRALLERAGHDGAVAVHRREHLRREHDPQLRVGAGVACLPRQKSGLPTGEEIQPLLPFAGSDAQPQGGEADDGDVDLPLFMVAPVLRNVQEPRTEGAQTPERAVASQQHVLPEEDGPVEDPRAVVATQPGASRRVAEGALLHVPIRQLTRLTVGERPGGQRGRDELGGKLRVGYRAGHHCLKIAARGG